ncbi:hypothetical protein OG21DRAFT_1490872 [Imleria badia]|nr:hypothetical protein OG21DRAFT_1490872 [Imleria badia]
MGMQRLALEQWNQLKKLRDQTWSDDALPTKKVSKAKKVESNKLTKPSKAARNSTKEGTKRTTGNLIERFVDDALRAKRSEERTSVPHVIEPAQQIAPTSILGKALAEISKRRKKPSSSDSEMSLEDSTSTSSSSESDPDSSDSSSSDSSPSSGDSSGQEHQNRCQARKLKRKKKRSKKACKSKKNRHTGYGKMKPITPLVYSGQKEVTDFHQFVTEGTAFVKAGGVRPQDQVFVLSHFLSCDARDFYMREVASNPYEWHLKDFFVELFNNCFPITFCTEQCEKLK